MSIVVWDSTFEEVFQDYGGPPFGHPFGYLSFLYAFIHFSSQSVVDGGEFLNQNPCMPSRPGVFQFGIFLSITSSASRCISTLGPSSSNRNFVSVVLPT